MGKYIVRRLLLMIPVLVGTTFLIYAMVFALPGDPTDNKCGERPCSPAYIAAFRDKYNLDDPLPVQYVKYMGNVLQGDFGTNQRGVPVLQDIEARYPTTVKLALMAVVIELIIGIVAGVLAGVRKGKFLDQMVLVSTLLVISIPIFVIGSTSQLVLGLKLGLFPISVPSANPSLFDLLLPAFVLASTSVAYIARLTRTNLVDNLRADYVRTAKAKGLTRSRTIGVHALRNSMIPVITFIGYDLGALLGGALVTERIFNINGIGGYLFRAIPAQDGVVIVGVVTLGVLIYLAVNLLVDLMYGVLDPRISHD